MTLENNLGMGSKKARMREHLTRDDSFGIAWTKEDEKTMHQCILIVGATLAAICGLWTYSYYQNREKSENSRANYSAPASRDYLDKKR